MSAAKRRRRVDGVGQHVGVAGHDDDVVEGERLEAVEELVWCSCGGSVRRARAVGTRSARVLDEQAVLGGVDRGPSRLVEGVVGVDRNVGRRQHRSVVDALVGHEVDHHAGAVARRRRVPRAQARSIASRAGELAGQRRVEVDDHAGEPAEEAHREDPHPAGEHDPVGGEAGDDVGEAGVVVGRGLAGDGGTTCTAGTPAVGGALQRAASGRVGDDGDDLGGRRPSAQASRIACRLVPLPEASTTRRRLIVTLRDRQPRLADVRERDRAGAGDERADHPGRLGDRRLHRVGVGRRRTRRPCRCPC